MTSRREFVKGAALLLGASGSRVFAEEPPEFELFDTHLHLTSNDTVHFPLTKELQAGLGGKLPDNPAPAASVGHWATYERTPLAQRIARYPNPIEDVLRLWTATGVTGGVGVQYRTAYGTDNSYVLDCSRRYPRQLCPVIVVDTERPDAITRLRAMTSGQPIAGVRLSGLSDAGKRDWLISHAARAVWAEAERQRLVIVLLPLPAEPQPEMLNLIVAMAKEFPKTSVVLDHSGFFRSVPDSGTAEGASLRAMVGCPNLYLKFSNVNYNLLLQAHTDPQLMVKAMVDLFGPTRIMWGSAYGSTAGPYETLVGQIVSATGLLDAKERAAMLADNGRRVFGQTRI